MTLAEIRRRVREGGAGVPRALVAALREDSRAGARLLAEDLDRRRRRELSERRRLRLNLANLHRIERALHAQGTRRVAGVDEVGVGPLAGPVVAAAVVLPREERLPDALIGLDDSKHVARGERERLAIEIRRASVDVAIGWASPSEIDGINIYQASLLAMRRAVERLDRAPQRVLVDARTIPGLEVEQEAVAGGDGRVAAIAAASIVAKVYRDAWMRDLDARHHGYGFANNAGYATPEHRRALARLGPTVVHRYSFAPVREAAARRRVLRR